MFLTLELENAPQHLLAVYVYPVAVTAVTQNVSVATDVLGATAPLVNTTAAPAFAVLVCALSYARVLVFLNLPATVHATLRKAPLLSTHLTVAV